MSFLHHLIIGYNSFCSLITPVLLVHFFKYEHKMSKMDYLMGYDDGEIASDERWEKKHRKLFDELKHGDEDHQKWLKTKIDDYFQLEDE